MATIAVEMPVASASSEQTEALLRACNIAAAPDHCELAGSTSETPVAFAVVTWHGELSVHVEVGHPDTKDWLERRITFQEEDPPIERWQAVGFTIGTLFEAGGQPTPPASLDAPEPEPVAPSAKARRSPAPRAEVSHHSVQTAALGRVGSGTESSARFGVGLLVAARLADGPFLSGDINLDLADARLGPPPASLSARFVTMGLSLGTGLTLAPKLRLDLSAGPILEYEWLWTDQATTTQSRFIGGARGSVNLAQRFGSRVWLGVGAQLGSRFGDTAVTIDGERVDSIPLLFATATLSVAFDVWRGQARTDP